MIIPAYTIAFALVFAMLSVRTLRLRGQLGVGLGDGDKPSLRRAIRAHANFAEYVPIALLTTYFLELRGGPTWLLHGLCGALLLGRCIHAFGLSLVQEPPRVRVLGMALTLTALCGSALGLLGTYF